MNKTAARLMDIFTGMLIMKAACEADALIAAADRLLATLSGAL